MTEELQVRLLVSGLWSYNGWNQLNFATEEFQVVYQNSRKVIQIELFYPLKNLPSWVLIVKPLVTLSGENCVSRTP